MTEENTANELAFTIPTKDLVHALNFAISIVERNNAISHLSHIKLTTCDQGLILSATDMDIYCNQLVGAHVKSYSTTTAHTQVLLDVIRKLPDEKITIQTLHHENSTEYLEIIGNNCKFQIPTLSPIQFPQIEDIENSDKVRVSNTDLLHIIENTQSAMSLDETRYNLNGIFLYTNDNALYAVATDCHRLSLSCVNANISQDNKLKVIIPQKTIQELLKQVQDTKNLTFDIDITFSDSRIKFQYKNITLISKLINGTFPDYSSFIPENNHNKLQIESELLSDAIDRITAITVKNFRAVKLNITKEKIVISASGESKGSGVEIINFADLKNNNSYDGEDIEIGFNPIYILDALKYMKKDHVNIFIGSTLSPVLIKNQKREKDTYVIMPIRV